MGTIGGVRRQLLDLHGALVEAERREYERARGRLPHREFLDALLNDPQLAWLKPLTALVVQEDALDPEQLRALLRPDAEGSEFQRRYADALQRSADVAVAHGRTMSALRASRDTSRAQGPVSCG